MNEFSAKKLGEVLAFADVGLETFDKGREAFEKTLGENFAHMREEIISHKDLLHSIADECHVLDIVMKKLESTGEKLRKMRDLYVGDEWDNPTELMEWSGFFEGAAIAHWQLVRGVSESTSHATLSSLSDRALKFHEDFFAIAKDALREVGVRRSNSN